MWREALVRTEGTVCMEGLTSIEGSVEEGGRCLCLTPFLLRDLHMHWVGLRVGKGG